MCVCVCVYVCLCVCVSVCVCVCLYVCVHTFFPLMCQIQCEPSSGTQGSCQLICLQNVATLSYRLSKIMDE